MRILFVKLSAIGDIIHALPALAAAKRQFPDAAISWVAESRSAEILRGNALIDDLIEIDTRSLKNVNIVEKVIPQFRSMMSAVRRNKYDIAIDLQGLIKSSVIAKLSGAPVRWGFSRSSLREPSARLLMTHEASIPERTHIIRKNLILAGAALGFDPDTAKIEFPISVSDEHRAEAAAIIERSGERFAILNPAGGWVTKLWHAEKYGHLADRISAELGITPVVVTAPNESGLAAAVRSASSGNVLFAEPSLKGFYELARHAAVYVGGDTGPTHLAVAAGAPVVGIFGPTEWWRNGSPREDDIEVGRTDITCRVDCHRRTCSAWICMDIDVGTVFRSVVRRLGL